MKKNLIIKILEEIQQILNQRIFIVQKYQKKHQSNLIIEFGEGFALVCRIFEKIRTHDVIFTYFYCMKVQKKRSYAAGSSPLVVRV